MNTPNELLDLTRHPCFNKAASGSCGRAHLPVAPKCNIKCNYCDRRHDCVNESRPGVSSTVLTPHQAVAYMKKVLIAEPRITVAGIAGPGDPFANVAETLTTMRLIRKEFPQLILCLATNGFNLPDHLDALAEIGATHVTVTMNAIDPAIGEHIYSFVRDGKVVFRGREAAEMLLSRQIASIKGLKERGMTVKVNSIVIPGINEHHIPDIAKVCAHLDVDLHNLMPMHPNPATPFADIPEPDKELMASLREECGELLPQMTHCRRCRADAVGLLCSDRSQELLPEIKACSKLAGEFDKRPYVAVATREGALVNQHLGEATRLQIWSQDEGGYKLVDERVAPKPGTGPQRWDQLAEVLRDCRAMLAQAMGETPRSVLESRGIACHECSGFIEEALAAVFSGANLSLFKSRRQGLSKGCARAGCGGGGEGC